MKKVLFTATVDSHILHFHIPYLKMFKENGYEVHIATNGDDEIPYCDKKHKISFERNPIKINNIKAIKSLKKIIKEEKYDIIHTHTPMGSVVTRLAAKKARKNGTRVIYTAHGFHFFKGASKLNWIIFYPIEKYLSKYTDDLITINNEDYELAKKRFKAKNTHYVEGVGVDPEKFDFEFSEEEKEKLREEINVNKEDFVMVYPAELSKRKNQTMLIEVMKELVKEDKGYKLLLPGKDSLNGKHKELVEKYNLQENIKFLGYRKDIPKLFKISDLAVSTAKQEGLPVNIIEAMMCGLPVVATNCRGNRDLVKKGENGYIVGNDDKNELYERIRDIKNNIQMQEQFKERNRNECKKFELKSIEEKMNGIYKKKINVLHLLSSNKYSGAENVVIQIINKFKQKEKYGNVIYLATNGDIEKKLIESQTEYILLDRINKKEILKIVKERNIDIVHAHDFNMTFLASRIKIKKIAHLHNNPVWIKSINIKAIIFLISAIRYKKILLVSNSIKEEYIFSKLIRKKFQVIQNPIERKVVEEKIKESKSREVYDIIFLGRLTDQKNPIKFLEIVKSAKNVLEDFQAIMVGDGELRKECEAYIKANKLEKNVKLTRIYGKSI